MTQYVLNHFVTGFDNPAPGMDIIGKKPKKPIFGIFQNFFGNCGISDNKFQNLYLVLHFKYKNLRNCKISLKNIHK